MSAKKPVSPAAATSSSSSSSSAPSSSSSSPSSAAASAKPPVVPSILSGSPAIPGDAGSTKSPTRRHSVVDRRSGLDRRDYPSGSDSTAAAAGGELSTNLERRRGPGRRRTDFMKSAEEGEMTQEQFLFVMAIDAFKRVNDKTFPTWTDVLEVIRKLGYRKTMPSELSLGPQVEDWTEKADAPCGVFKTTTEEG